ncbi:MAG: LysM peptidoglycan-binding domain-containing protein [Bacteriovoracales bacterium]|nr:LysM peptidoglycan-binding domain-containing protein [Bacteriovoracales bacterium]
MRYFLFLLLLSFSFSAQSQKEDFFLDDLDDLDELDEITSDLGDDDFFQSEPSPKTSKERPKPKKERSKKTVKRVKRDRQKSKKDKNLSRKKIVPKKAISSKKKERKEKTSRIEEFDVGAEEAEILRLARTFGNKISHNEWNEVAKLASSDTYTVVENDNLWEISKTLFGTGFYYPKIWSLNPYITNPHKIEPGMVLVFSSGSEKNPPEVRLGSFDSGSLESTRERGKIEIMTKDGRPNWDILSRFAEDARPPWLKKRQEFIDQGYSLDSISDFTYEDLLKKSSKSLFTDYKHYEPPNPFPDTVIPKNFDELGFDKSSIERKKIKSGFYLNTFLTNYEVQDFGKIDAGQKERSLFFLHDIVYVRFNPEVKVFPGDRFSIYIDEGTVQHKSSERKGYRYTVKGDIVVNQQKEDLWECQVVDVVGEIFRHDRITMKVPRIEKILTTFNQRKIEAVIIGAFKSKTNLIFYGDVVYLDRGKVDGVEIGNVFNVYSSKDLATSKEITSDPTTYTTGELTVISLSENFSTAIVTQSTNSFEVGQLVVTKTMEEALRGPERGKPLSQKERERREKGSLEEVDVRLDMDDLEKELNDKVDGLELSDEELDKLEEEEREKSFLKDHIKDEEELSRMEEKVKETEEMLHEEEEDQNKILEQGDLDDLEKKLDQQEPDAFESLDEIEEDIGKKYLDEDLNAKDNPYGLTEFDLEEIDELLNTSPDAKNVKDEGDRDQE